MKKILTLILTASLALSLSIPALANEDMTAPGTSEPATSTQSVYAPDVAVSYNVGWNFVPDYGHVYIHPDKSMAKGLTTIKGQKFYFGGFGQVSEPYVLQYGMIYDGDEGKMMFTNAKGVIIEKGGVFLAKSGVSHQEYIFLNAKGYYVGDLMSMVYDKPNAGWVHHLGKVYYYQKLNSDGKPSTGIDFGVSVLLMGWQKINGTQFYFGGNDDWAMKTGWQKVNGSQFYFGTDGKMRVHWQNINGSHFYFGTNGKMVTGWQKINGTQFYFDAAGKMVKGVVNIKGVNYRFDGNGRYVGLA